jgi:TolB protein
MRLVALFAAAAVIAGGIAAVGSATAPGKNGQIAFRRFLDDKHQTGAVFLINPDGSNERQLTHPPQGAIDAESAPLSFSPDGAKLLFTRTDHGTDEIWRVNADGSGATRLSPAPRYPDPKGKQINQQNADAIYSPNGRLIAFIRADPPSDKQGELRAGIHLMAADGSHVRSLFIGGYAVDISNLSWAPDGKHLVFSQVNLENRRPRFAQALFVTDTKSGRPHRISPWEKGEIVADWSPGGGLLLVQIKPPNSDFGGDYFTMHPDGSGLRRLTHLARHSTAGSARWSPDGKSIVFANNGVGGADDIFTMRADGTGITPVTRTREWDSAAVWGPAG